MTINVHKLKVRQSWTEFIKQNLVELILFRKGVGIPFQGKRVRLCTIFPENLSFVQNKNSTNRLIINQCKNVTSVLVLDAITRKVLKHLWTYMCTEVWTYKIKSKLNSSIPMHGNLCLKVKVHRIIPIRQKTWEVL